MHVPKGPDEKIATQQLVDCERNIKSVQRRSR
jgi:hypothetical protein